MTTAVPIRPLSPDSIVADLRGLDRWVTWRREPNKDGKPTKVPYQARGGRRADSTNPSTWAPFADAWAAYQKNGAASGIGFVCTLADRFVGVDLDHCVSPDGTVVPWAADIVDHLASYTERTPSGDGLRVWVRGAWERSEHKRAMPDGGAVEVYCTARYFTVTGHHHPGTPTTIEERSAQLAALASLLWPPVPLREAARPASGDALPADDAELLRRARAAKNGYRFERLWSGDLGEYGGDHSRADMALCALLAFWTQRDAGRMDRLFRQSGLIREKWDSRRGDSTYGAQTIDRAVRDCAEVYDPHRQASNHTGPGLDPDDPPRSREPGEDDDDPPPPGASSEQQAHRGRGPEPRLKPGMLVSAATLVAEGRRIQAEGIRCVIPDIIPDYGMLGFFVAFAKVGKSSTALPMVRAISTGGAFLGRECSKRRVLYLALEDPREYIAWMAARSLDGDEDALFYVGSLSLIDLVLDEVEALIRREGIGFVYVSTFMAGVRELVRDENDNGAIARVVEALKASARRAGVPYLFEAHAGKGEDQSAEADPVKSMRGASAAAAAADFVLSLKRDGRGLTTRRVLSGAGRFVSFPPISFDYDASSGRIEFLGSQKDAAGETTWRLIQEMGALSEEWQSSGAIARAAGLSENARSRKAVNHALHGRSEVERQTVAKGSQTTVSFRLAQRRPEAQE